MCSEEVKEPLEETDSHEHVFSKEDKSHAYGVSEPSGLLQTKRRTGWEAGVRLVGVGACEKVALRAAILLTGLVKPRGAQGTWEAHRTSAS